MMNYNILERAVRDIACKTLGAKSENFDRWLVTCNPNEGMEVEDFNFGDCVELSFEPLISPFSYFSSEVVFYVSPPVAQPGGAITPASVLVCFGRFCSDVEAAEAAAEDFLRRGVEDGWYIDSCFDPCLWLELRYELGTSFESDEALLSAIEDTFAELCDNRFADKLRPFIHYFED